MKTYTDRVDGFQIRDVCYLCDQPSNTPPRFDVVKWIPEKEPRFVTALERDENGKWYAVDKWSEEHCYSVATLEWNAHEPWFEFHSVGTRWLEENPTDAVVKMILDFCNEKAKELDRD